MIFSYSMSLCSDIQKDFPPSVTNLRPVGQRPEAVRSFAVVSRGVFRYRCGRGFWQGVVLCVCVGTDSMYRCSVIFFQKFSIFLLTNQLTSDKVKS